MVKIQPMKAPPATNAIKKDKKSDLILRTKNKQSDLYLFLSSCQRKFVIIEKRQKSDFSVFFLITHQVILLILHW